VGECVVEGYSYSCRPGQLAASSTYVRRHVAVATTELLLLPSDSNARPVLLLLLLLLLLLCSLISVFSPWLNPNQVLASYSNRLFLAAGVCEAVFACPLFSPSSPCTECARSALCAHGV
jgi:hypothetical protein